MNILITSGGGAKGAFSVGALRQLLITNTVSSFDLISGTSTGALIAAMVASGKVPEVIDIYLNNSNADVLNTQNVIDNLSNGKPYLYDTAPLEAQIRQQIDDDAYKRIMLADTVLCLNSVCLQSGRLTVFSNKTLKQDMHYDNIVINSREMLVKAMLASSNQAAFMIPVELNGKQYVDGGNREVIPTRAVISNLSATAAHQIFILSNNPDNQAEIDTHYTQLLDVALRAITIFIQEVRENDLEVLRNYRKIAPVPIKVFYIAPDEELDTQYPTGLNFNKLQMQAWMKAGQLRAKEILTKYPNGNL